RRLLGSRDPPGRRGAAPAPYRGRQRQSRTNQPESAWYHLARSTRRSPGRSPGRSPIWGVVAAIFAARQGGMMPGSSRWPFRPALPLLAAVLVVATPIAVALSIPTPTKATAPAVQSADTPFSADMDAAMATMMAAMRIEPSGDVDADFVAM